MCFGASGLVRATSMPQRAMCARVVQTFWPLTIHSSPSRTGPVVASPATSEPALGSLNSWHQISRCCAIGGSRLRFISSLPHCMIVGPPMPMPMMLNQRGTL